MSIGVCIAMLKKWRVYYLCSVVEKYDGTPSLTVIFKSASLFSGFMSSAASLLTLPPQALPPQALPKMSRQDSHHVSLSKSSCIQGPLEPALRTWTIRDLLQHQAEQFPRHLAVSCPGTSNGITYHQLNDRTKLLGQALIANRIYAGDRVGIFAGNVSEYIEIVLATARIGAIVVLLNTFYTTEEIKRALRFTGK